MFLRLVNQKMVYHHINVYRQIFCDVKRTVAILSKKFCRKPEGRRKDSDVSMAEAGALHAI